MKALVTGANKGIGFAIAQELGQKGYEVFVGARDEVRGQAAVNQLTSKGIQAKLIKIDLNDFSSLKEAGKVIDQLDLLVNNAGIPGNIASEKSARDMSKSAFDYTTNDLKETLAVNFLGTHELIKCLLPKLSKEGKILNVTVPVSGNQYWQPLAYITSKAALNVMTMAFGNQFIKEGSQRQIFGVMPGAVATDLNGATANEHVKTPEAAAHNIIHFLFDGKNHNGQIVNHDGTEISAYEPNLFVVRGAVKD